MRKIFRKGNFLGGKEKKKRRGKIFFLEENKTEKKRGNTFGEGKGGRYLISGGEEKLRRKIFCQLGRRKRRKIFGEG